MSKPLRARLYLQLLQRETDLHQKGIRYVAGVDEVGRGCLAGPVFAAAVIFPLHIFIDGVDDSKKLSPQRREELFPLICSSALSWSVARIEADEIDRINIHRASLFAMQKAVEDLRPGAEHILVDGRFPLPGFSQRQEAIIGGDGLCHVIAAASILAKVSRDRWMVETSREYPGFSFDRHKGYGTARHLDEIRHNGLTPLHRRSFKPKAFF